jgi:hypothetical protein
MNTYLSPYDMITGASGQYQTIYECPANSTVLVKTIQCTNITGFPVEVSVLWADTNVGVGTSENNLALNFPISGFSSSSIFRDGFIALTDGEKIKASCNYYGAAYVLISAIQQG